jgi:hypothetical protein
MPTPTSDGSVPFCSQDASYDWHKNDPLTVSYTPSQAARISVIINLNNDAKVFKILDAAPHFAGYNYSLDWTGFSPEEIVIFGNAVAECYVDSLLPGNVIITTGKTPTISHLKADPYEIHLSYGEYVRIIYDLSRGANVTLQLKSSTGLPITLLNGEWQSAGQHVIEWNGINAADLTRKQLLISEEGDYTISIQAVNQGAIFTKKGLLRIWK